ncbi:DUF5686 and carboxypeptidase regulatory-like domain-containing protein [Leeuwenhoekiella nanhaiensis]|uniref:Carboxypeptidase-like regulatory domain-containing protein n=1 Tax=Leeuwenhoekiella nanhaiensis TaxID=1655491 RepID=A0A2G1VU14_9FLAO|nr:DUF5686 and carboxypeptidase regulatory-like domain-containing protein [Leeuwenhoekiella nanhaiensis]PHQ30273.1 hypothetical protein CJ305_04735 [Leeuwenhoekiella nanhaiensis]
MIQKLLFFALLLLSFTLQAQVTGLVTDADNNSLPYVNVYVKDATLGTTTNASGTYQLQLDKPGTYTLVFQFLGFTKQEIEINPQRFPYVLDVTLKPETTSLDEVVVDAKSNPADRIIRAVIAKKSQILEKKNAYTADFYSRGIWRVENAPEKFFGQDIGDLGGGLDSTRSGIVYLSETLSKIAVRKPDDFKETITASKVSGDDNGFSFNSAQEAEFSFYDNTLEVNTELVSPLADNAFNYYTYKLEGAFREGDKLINKITVSPKRENDRIFRGTLYIVEDDWQLYGVDLTTNGAAIQVPFIEFLGFKHSFKYDANLDLWVKISQNIDFSFKMLGFGGNGRFTAVYSNYNFNPDFERGTFTREVLSFKPEANKKDSVFWQLARPVPLTLEERNDYTFKDSLQEKRNSKPYKDSVDSVRNRFSLADPILGYSYQNSYKRWRLSYEGPITTINFNTVQGFNAFAGLSYNSWTEDYKQAFSVSAQANYGLDDERLRLTGRIAKRFNRTSRSVLSLTGGIKAQQFNAEEPITRLGNSFSTLIWKRNHIKLYDLEFVRLAYSEELVNGLQLSAQLGYEQRSPLFNTTDQTFFDWDFGYTSNNPLAPDDFNTAAFNKHSLAKLNLQAVIHFDQKYMSYPDGKFNLDESKYPTLIVGAEQAFAGSDKQYNFTEIKAELRQELSLGNKGILGYAFSGGTFFNADGISFVDYQHFNGNRTYLNFRDTRLTGFNNMPYYEYSTRNSFFEVHVEHNFKGFILGKIPGIRALNLNLIGGVHTLSTLENKPYTELNLGLDNLGLGKFKFFRLDYVHSFFGGGSEQAVVLGFKLSTN